MIVLANTITVDVEYVDVTSFASTTKSLKVKCFVGDASPLSGSFAASLLSKLVHALPALEYFVEDTKRVPSPGSTLPTPKFFLYFFSCNRKTSAVSCAARATRPQSVDVRENMKTIRKGPATELNSRRKFSRNCDSLELFITSLRALSKKRVRETPREEEGFSNSWFRMLSGSNWCSMILFTVNDIFARQDLHRSTARSASGTCENFLSLFSQQ